MDYTPETSAGSPPIAELHSQSLMLSIMFFWGWRKSVTDKDPYFEYNDFEY